MRDEESNVRLNGTRPDSPNDKTRRARTKLSPSTKVILLVLVLAAVCLLWTTEWMDRLQVFGNSMSYTKFVAEPTFGAKKKQNDTENTGGNTFSDENDDSLRVYDVFGVDESEQAVPTDISKDAEENPAENSDNKEGIPKPNVPDSVDSEIDEDPVKTPTERLPICVSSTNPRTASLFHSKTLQRKGDGRFDYVVTSKRCSETMQKSPVSVRMLYQKSLSNMSPSQLDTMFASPENLVIVMGDEFCRCPLDICSTKAHARQYYSESYVEYATKFPSQDANPTVYLPLGPRIEFPPVDESEVVPSSKRKLLLNLIVSPTSPSRKRLAAMVNKNAKVFSPVFVHVTPAFAGNATEAKGFVAPEEYRKTLLDSKFTLCPAGHNPEAFRLFEASEAGSIPVLVKDEEYLNHACKNSFAPMLASGAPFIVLDTWDDLAEALKPFMKDPAKLDDQQRKLRDWYTKFWKEIARDFECSIAQNLNKLVKGGKAGAFNADKFDMPDCLDDDQQEAEQDIDLATPKTDATTLLKPVPTKLAPTPLIVGCGRTGTLSLSHYLVQAVGVKSVHEKMEPNSISVSWLYAVPDAPEYPFEGRKSPKYRKLKMKRLARANLPLFSPVVHLVRHPLKVISSTRRCFCGRGTRSTGLGQASDMKSWQFVDTHIEMPKADLPYDSLLRSMTYWHDWNTLIESRHKVTVRLRIEDLDPNVLVEALSLSVPSGVELPNRVPRAPSHVSPEEEKQLLPDATWAELAIEDRSLAEKIFLLAKKYGYEIEANSLDDLI